MGNARDTRVRLAGPALAVAVLAQGLVARPAAADEPKKVTEPSVLREPTEIVQVADAFDDGDVFDLHLSLGYQHSWRNAKIYRENSILQTGLARGGFTASNLNVAKSSQTISRLNTRADIGVFKDISLIIRVPVILSDDRELTANGGTLQSTTLVGVPGEQLFNLPFKSPTRSGIEYLAIGMDFGPMNQARNHTKPTWIIGGEVRIDVSEPMHACNKNPTALNVQTTQVSCAYPHDINRDGIAGQPEYRTTDRNQPVVQLDAGPSGQRKPGVSRGTTGLAFHTFLSRRVKYIEPYGGFDVLFEFPTASSDYQATDLRGSLVNHPPLRGTMTVGIAVIPWEIRDAFQRLTIDGRFSGSYVSEGRDYNELFDALGSSDAPSVRYPQFSDYEANPVTGDLGNHPSVVDPDSQKVYYTGLTDVQQHGIYSFGLQATYQAGEFVKFNVGGNYTLVQGHFITFDQACNPDFNNNLDQSGPCRTGDPSSGFAATGIPNPNFRKAINDPGRRFKVDDSTGFDAWISATVMF
jgi:hypothetical protein